MRRRLIYWSLRFTVILGAHNVFPSLMFLDIFISISELNLERATLNLIRSTDDLLDTQLAKRIKEMDLTANSGNSSNDLF